MTDRPVLTVHTRAGVVEVPLTGDDGFDALLERVARRNGHTVTRDGVVIAAPAVDPDAAMREALKSDA